MMKILLIKCSGENSDNERGSNTCDSETSINTTEQEILRGEIRGWGGEAGVVMVAAWRRASLPPPPGLVSLSWQMKSCN